MTVGLIVLAVILGVILQFHLKSGPLSIPIGAFGMFLAYSYSGTPLKLSYHGLGEITLAFNNAWTPIFAGYYLQVHELDWFPTIVAIPYILGVFSQKLLREIPDVEYDSKARRRNLAVMLGAERASRLYSYSPILTILSLISIILLYPELLPFSLILIVPAGMLLKNLKLNMRGGWKDLKGLERLNDNGFKAMFAIPILFTLIFILAKVI
jgi:1,4-dihydroxy-2-naphthoate octaprenyltransferase